MRESELAWAAGFFDGEGCTTTARARLYLLVGQKDRRALDRFAAAVGLGNVNGPYVASGVHQWNISGRKAERVLGMLWPYLGAAKREQANRAIELVAQRKRYTCSPKSPDR